MVSGEKNIPSDQSLSDEGVKGAPHLASQSDLLFDDADPDDAPLDSPDDAGSRSPTGGVCPATLYGLLFGLGGGGEKGLRDGDSNDEFEVINESRLMVSFSDSRFSWI